jgi:large subunit ribosomal protein L6
MNVKNYKEEVNVNEGISAKVEGTVLTVSKDKATVTRDFRHPKLTISAEGNKISINIPLMTKREKTMLGTYRAHIRNMLAGVEEPFVYKLKVCSGHFPMNLSITKEELSVKNFIGEKVPRVLKIIEGVDVKLDGDVITVTSTDKEKAGRIAGAIELLCKRPGFDNRIFQQGIYIMEKAGKAV